MCTCWENLRKGMNNDRHRIHQEDEFLHGDDSDALGNRCIRDDLRLDHSAKIRDSAVVGSVSELDCGDETAPVSGEVLGMEHRKRFHKQH